MEVDFNKMHGYVYTRAADTSARFSVVATTFMEDEPRALYTHCHACLGDLMVLRFAGIGKNSAVISVLSILCMTLFMHL